MFDFNLPALILLSSLATSAILLLMPEQEEKLRNYVNLLSGLVIVGLVGTLIGGVYQGIEYETRLPLLPNLDLVLHADKMSLLFVSLSAVLWCVTSLYAVGYLQKGPNRSRFFGFFSLCVFATLGIALAGNLITFLIFYELLTLATYPLVVHKGNKESLHAGKVYLTYTMVGGAILLIGVVWLKSIAGALDFTSSGVLATIPDLPAIELIIIFALLMIGLGVKAALVPLHGWLPVAMAAPAPVSALLHAVAVVKAGAFGIVRVLYDVYGIEFANSLGVTFYLAIAAAITIIYGSLRALFQDDLKKRLAYSTVSQVSYIALGAAIAGPLASIGGIVHLVHQGLMKITLFFCAGNITEATGLHKVSQLNGLGKRMPITMAALTLASLGMIGIPPLAGFVSKWYLGVGAMETQAFWILAILAGSSILNAMYFLPIIYRVWFLQADSQPETSFCRSELNWMMLLPPVLTVSLALAAGLFANSQISALYWVKLIVSQEYLDVLTGPAQSGITLNSFILILILTPLLFAFACLLPRVGKKFAMLSPIAAIPALALAFAFSGSDFQLHIPWLFFGSTLGVDSLSRPFLLLAACLWFVGALYSVIYLFQDKNRTAFLCFFNLAMSGSFGLILSQDMFGFITFFTLMSLASYGLILHDKTPIARLAGASYMRWVIVGEVTLFSAFCTLVAAQSWSYLSGTNFLAISSLLLIVGFGIKSGVLGLHFWLPKAHPVAPIPASALLSGLMVKAGILGWMKFMPSAPLYSVDAANLLIVIGMLGAYAAVFLGLLQRNPKAILAYSTISQMGLLSAAFGAYMLQPSDLLIVAIIFYSMHHGFAKAALFFSVGTFPLINGTQLQRIAGYAFFMIPALMLVGLPMTSGGFAKTALKEGLSAYPTLTMLLTLSALGTSLLMLRIFFAIRTTASEYEKPNTKHNWLVIPTTLILALLLWLPFWSPLSTATVIPSLAQSITLSVPVFLAIACYFLLRKVLNWRFYVAKISEIQNKFTSNLLSLAAQVTDPFLTINFTPEFKHKVPQIRKFTAHWQRELLKFSHTEATVLFLLAATFAAAFYLG